MHDILGLNPIVLASILVVAGVGLHTTLGWLQSTLPPNPKKIAASVIIGCFASFGIVTPVIQQLMTNPGSEFIQFATLVGAIAAIAGIDSLVKNVGNAIKVKVKPKIK